MKPFAELTNRGQIGRLRRLAAAAAGEYDIPSPRFTALFHGDNTTFRIDAADGQRYVIRIRRPPPRTRAVVESEMAWLDALRRDTDLQVPAPVRRRAGGYVTEASTPGVPETRMCVVLRWLPGRFVDRRLTARHLQQVGVLTARLHDHGASWQPPRGFVRGRLDNLYGKPPPTAASAARRTRRDRADEEEALAAIAAVRPAADVGRCRALIERYRSAQAHIGFGKRSFGLIHGDLHQENYLFGEGGIALIDFDDCGFGHHVYDTAVTLVELSFRPSYPALREAYLDGYRSVRPFPSHYEEQLEAFMRYRDLQIMLWAIELRDHPLWRGRWRQEADAVMRDIARFIDG